MSKSSLRLFYVFAVACTQFYLAPTAYAQFESCGTELLTFRGIPAYANGADTNTGTPCNGRGTYGLEYQCVELVKRYYAERLGHDVSSWRFDAYDLFDNASTLGLDAYSNNGSVAPRVEDIMVFRGGEEGYGHVAIVTEVDDNVVRLIEQNWGSNAVGTLRFSRSSNGNYIVEDRSSSYETIGWLRKPGSSNPPADIAGEWDVEISYPGGPTFTPVWTIGEDGSFEECVGTSCLTAPPGTATQSGNQLTINIPGFVIFTGTIDSSGDFMSGDVDNVGFGQGTWEAERN